LNGIMDDLYLTIDRSSRIETKVKGSRFIAEALPAATVAAANEALEMTRKREHAAAHHCFAWRVGREENKKFKYSDDGEPSGTAGKPIFDILYGRDLTNSLVIVTRYFGGTKLGTGGLVRAYSDAARQALDRAGTRERYLTDRLRISVAFSFYDSFTRLTQKYQTERVSADFSEQTTQAIDIRRSHTDKFVAELTEMTNGQAMIERLDEVRADE